MLKYEKSEPKAVAEKVDLYHVMQPILNLSHSEILGYEAQIRSEKFKLVDNLFDYVDNNGELFDLDLLSVQMAFKTYKERTKAFKDMYLFINIFPSTMAEPAFHISLTWLTTLMKIDPQSVVFVISEPYKEFDSTAFNEAVNEIKDLGFLVAMSNIGNSFFTIKQIAEIKPDLAMIDQYFANELNNSIENQILIQMVCKLFGNDIVLAFTGFEDEKNLKKAVEIGVTSDKHYKNIMLKEMTL